MDRLTAMRVFVEVVETGSQTAAAERLEMSRAMVTRYLAELEGWLGARLLNRSTRRLSLTDVGEECLAHCRELLSQVGELQSAADARSAAPRGLVRLTMASLLGQTLAPMVADYVRRHPAVHVDLLLVDRTVNLVEERVDLAIRISNDIDPLLVARKLGVCRSVVCASPAYLAERGTPQCPPDLAQHNCLTYAYFGKSQWRFRQAGQAQSVAVSGNLSANETSALLSAAVSGAGISHQPEFLAAPLLQSGALQQVLADYQPDELGIWGVYATRQFLPGAVRSLLDFLAERFSAEPAWRA